MSRRYVDQLLRFDEREIVIAGLWQYTGFRQIPLTIEKPTKAKSDYSLISRVQLLLRCITGFTSMPLRCIFWLGSAVLAGAALAIVRILVILMLGGQPPSGYASVFVSLWFLGGLILFSIGIVASYLAVVFEEVKNRPFIIVQEVYGAEQQLPSTKQRIA